MRGDVQLQWLRETRKQKKFSQNEVATRCGISQPAYNKIETSHRLPRVATAKKIAAVLGFDWQRFYEDDARTSA
jgi:transcriptional regulator with XRE-family HTH domain